MESVWWVVKQLWDKGLIYQGVKVMPISTELGTVLSNFEATSNYQDVQDPAITVLLKLRDEDAYLAIWTTTPWTLPSNLAVCVGPDIAYAKVRDRTRDVVLYIAEARLDEYRKAHDLEVHRDVPGPRSGGAFVRTVVPVLRRTTRAGRVRRADGRLRHHRIRYRPRASGAGVRRRRLPRRQSGRHRSVRMPGHAERICSRTKCRISPGVT